MYMSYEEEDTCTRAIPSLPCVICGRGYMYVSYEEEDTCTRATSSLKGARVTEQVSVQGLYPPPHMSCILHLLRPKC